MKWAVERVPDLADLNMLSPKASKPFDDSDNNGIILPSSEDEEEEAPESPKFVEKEEPVEEPVLKKKSTGAETSNIT